MQNDAVRRPDHSGGARTFGILVIAGALAVTLNEIVAEVLDTRGLSLVVVACTTVLFGCGVIALLAPQRLPRHLADVLTPSTIPIIVAINIATQDSGGGAQVAFVLPVVYAGAFRSARVTWLTAAIAVVGELTTTFTALPAGQALTDSILVTIAVVALASLLRTGRRQQDALVAELSRLASLDPLTGLVTRRVLDQRAAEITSGAGDRGRSPRQQPSRTPPPPAPKERGLGLLVLDIDHFKAINDKHGHPAGDSVLSSVGTTIRSTVRSGDTVARLGGDEFAVLFPHIDRTELQGRADAVRAAVASTISLEGAATPVTVTVSGGAAHGDAATTRPEHLYRVADAALYEAKRSGRDRVLVVDVTAEQG